MSSVKAMAQTDGMSYELAGSKKVSSVRRVVRNEYKNLVNEKNSMYTLWLLAVKHKVALLALGNIILLANWIAPSWFTFVTGLVH